MNDPMVFFIVLLNSFETKYKETEQIHSNCSFLEYI